MEKPGKRRHKVTLENVRVKVADRNYNRVSIGTSEDNSYNTVGLEEILMGNIPVGTYRVNIKFEIEEVDSIRVKVDTDFGEKDKEAE